MKNNNKKLKAFVRFDGSGRVISSSLILQYFKPKVGKWKEITAYECCNPTTTPVSFLLKEDGFEILQENNDKILKE